jgi:hypothetical protein
MKKLKLAFAIGAAAALCLTSVPAASAAGPENSNRESQIDAVLESSFWSKTTPATKAQEANRKALSLEVKEALVNVSQKNALSSAESSALAKAGLADVDPKNTTWKYTEAVTVPVPVSKSAAANPLAVNLAAASCWITRAEVQKWSFATQSFGWKRQVDWCADGSRVTSRHRDFPSVGYVDFTYHYRGADAIQANAVGGWQVRTYQAATFEQCPTNLGCISTYRPWIEFQLYGNNTVTHTKGV